MKSMPALAFLATFAGATAARAHDGHGPQGPHWHATDAWGFAAGALAVAALWWLLRGKR